MPKPLHILCFGAHPDDSEIFAGGLLLAFKAAGAKVTIVIGTDGSLSGGYPSNDALAATRTKEAKAGAAIIGAELEMLGFRDGYLSMASEAEAAINAALERHQPDLVVTHHANDPHRDHREMSRLVTARIDPNQRLIYFEPIYGLTQAPNLLIDTSAHWETKAAAIAVHESQRAAEEITPGIKTWNKFRALQMSMRGVRTAEGYIVPASPFANPMRVLESVAKVKRV